MDQNTTPTQNTEPQNVAPAAAAPVAPAPQAEPQKQPDPVKSSLLSSILKLSAEEPKKEEPKPEPKKEDPAPKVAASPAKPEPKKVTVSKKAPAPATADVVETAVSKAIEKMAPMLKPQPAQQPVEQTPAEPDLNLNDDQREEVELAEWLEKKDPSKKGLSSKVKAFYKAEQEFLAKRQEAEGDDYDPATDPAYRKFLAANEPKISKAERKAAFREMVTAQAEERSLKKATETFDERFKRQERELREIKERPVIDQTITSFAKDVFDSVPEPDFVKFYSETHDPKKTEEAFPVESAAVIPAIQGAVKLANTYLSLRRGLTEFNPTPGSEHEFLDKFLATQANALLKVGGDALVRDGKTFVHPAQWNPATMANTHWTFEDSDVLLLLKHSAVNEAKARIAAERRKIDAVKAAEARRTAQNSAAPVANAEPEAGVKSGAAAPVPGAANSSAKPTGKLSSLFNL